MTSRADIEMQKSSEEALRRRLDRLGWSCITAEQVEAERGSSREVLLKDRLTTALLRLNEWLTRPQADRVIFELENINAVGMAGNRAAHLNLVYGMPLTTDGPRGRESRVVRFFDFDHPQDGLNDFVAASEFAIRPAGETDQEGRTPATAILDLVLFVNGLPLVAIEVKPALGRGSPEVHDAAAGIEVRGYDARAVPLQSAVRRQHGRSPRLRCPGRTGGRLLQMGTASTAGSG